MGDAEPSLRRTVVVLLSLFSLVGYGLRMNISIASPFMMADLHLDKIQPLRRFYAVDARNHRFSGGKAAFDAALLDALRWIVAQSVR